jgi:transcriptional regulator with XRE-family HTH domain
MALDPSSYFNNERFANGLKYARQNRELTLDQLSKVTKLVDPKQEGVSRVALSRYETGASLPGVRELRLLSFALRQPLSFLLYQQHVDPMLNYKTSLEMRLVDMAFDTELANGVIKTELSNQPADDPKYLALLSQARGKDLPAE